MLFWKTSNKIMFWIRLKKTVIFTEISLKALAIHETIHSSNARILLVVSHRKIMDTIGHPLHPALPLL